MDRVLIDTSVIIDFWRRRDKDGALLTKIKGNYNMVLSFVTITEFYSGLSSRDKEAINFIEDMITWSEVRMISVSSARESGKLRRDWQLSLGDGFIAQLSLEEDLPLATLNTKDFGKVKGIKLFKI